MTDLETIAKRWQKLKTEGKGFIIVTSTDNNPKVLP